MAVVKLFYTETLQNSPIIASAAILDYAKIELYKFIYEYLSKFKTLEFVGMDGLILKLDISPEALIKNILIFLTLRGLTPVHIHYIIHA